MPACQNSIVPISQPKPPWEMACHAVSVRLNFSQDLTPGLVLGNYLALDNVNYLTLHSVL